MRKLMWFALGFTVGCGLCAYGLERAWILPGFLAAAGVFLLSLLFVRKGNPAKAVSIACFGLAVSLGWFSLFYQGYLQDVVLLDGREESAAITVTDYSYETDYGIGFDGRLTVNDKSYKVRVYLNETESLTPGDTVRGIFRFRVTTGDGEKTATNHPGKGIFLLAYQRGNLSVLDGEAESLTQRSSVLRKNIKEILESCFPEEGVAFARALLLGDTSGLSYEQDTDLKVSGIRHVVAVSGLHISILFALISTVTFRKRFLTAALGIPVLVLFAAVAGFSPSVVRACVMSGLMLLSLLLDREYDGPTALSFAVVLMLAVNPLAVTSVSLQLSAASVAGIFCFREPVQNWISGWFGKPKRKGIIRLVRWFSSSVAITLSAMVFTTPLCAYYFGMVSLVGPVTNLLTLWVISFIFYGIMAVCGAHFLWQGGAVLLAKLVSWPIRYVLLMAKTLADFPLAAVYTASFYIVLWLIFSYLLLGVFLLQKRRRPVELICCISLGLCVVLLAGWWEPARDNTRLTVLDVGQGQAVLLQHEGRHFLIDCGGDSDAVTANLVTETLLSQGIDKLDGLILTHYDRDHAGALENLLTRIPVEVLLLPDTVNAIVPKNGEGTLCYVDDTLQIDIGSGKITVFGPMYDGEDNENSMCVLFEGENCAILITGDRSAFGERMLIRREALPDVDVLIAGHHGSKDSTSEALLTAVKPETVIISVGEGNVYGHPDPELLQRLSEFGCTVYRTDLHGTVVYRR